MGIKIKGSRRPLRGEIKVPADKSISHRAVMFGAISDGKVDIDNFLMGEDCLSTVEAFRALGIRIEQGRDALTVHGNGLRGLKEPLSELYLGNSGTTMRVISGILSGQGFDTVLTGDGSLSRRPMERVITPLRLMGVTIKGTGDGMHAPLYVNGTSGKLKHIHYDMPVASAQVKSCVLAAGLYADGPVSVGEPFISRDHTERMLAHLSVDVRKEGRVTTLVPPEKLVPVDITVPGDISSAAFFIAAALIVPGSDVLIRDVGLNPTRTGLLEVLRRMGADISISGFKDEGVEPCGDIRVRYGALKGGTVKRHEIPLLIDEIPVFMVVAAFASGMTRIEGAGELKVKESDRVASMKHDLSLLGVKMDEVGEDIIVEGGIKALRASVLESFMDHRIAMSMLVAALASDGECTINDHECVAVSYPGFLGDLASLAG
ncbi:MAG: 3-phosphoshikimate 1-carboxyvinyltransferase [Candidatus Omnitrophica bacterium]|nr:3-phosphoshikimate 1-carboxyvinyltransferase [Candidatus Omnitrophota bacterium]MDD5488367.1 3-phosphoshikimate 1-carboxyvinyltransferase [Candidatus Omnitrophota bacterium]